MKNATITPILETNLHFLNDAMSDITIIIIFSIIALGLYSYIKIALNQPSLDRLKSFFLGGGKIGPALTEANTIGVTFAWAGGIWFFVWLAYQYGPVILLSQIFWAGSIFIFSILAPRIIPLMSNKTLHGFLGDKFGPPTRLIASIATTMGYFIVFGFEIYWAAKLFSDALGSSELTIIVAILLALICSLYCSIGGYWTNAVTDRHQNIFAVISLGLLVFLISLNSQIGKEFSTAAVIFCVGCIIYVINSLLVYSNRFERLKDWQNYISYIFVIMAFIVVFYILDVDVNTSSELAFKAFHSESIPWSFIFAAAGFQLFFNIVDMQNWQQLAANNDLKETEYKAVSHSIRRGSLYLFWFPALGAILVGCAMRALGTELDEDTVMSAAFQLLIPEYSEYILGILLGVIFFGLLASAISTGDSLLMCAIQTLIYDIFMKEEVKSAISTGNEKEENKIVSTTRKILIPLAITLVVLFYLVDYYNIAVIFNFQYMMYAFAISLFMPILVALFAKEKTINLLRNYVTAGITLSLITLFGMFLMASFGFNNGVITPDSLFKYMPYTANIVSFTVIIIGLLFIKIRKNNGS